MENTRWTFISRGQGRKDLCRCSCGTERLVNRADMKSGKTKSCGCLSRELTAIRGKLNRTHGMEGSRTYLTWIDMRRRCSSPHRREYARYGGRGIRVCDRWHSFAAFLADMGIRPPGFTLDRINLDGHYEPENCRWADRRTQERNKSTTYWVVWGGRRMSLVEACEVVGIGYQVVRGRLRRGWSIDDALTAPVAGAGRR